MFIKLGTVDGRILKSKETSAAQWQAEIDAADGKTGYGEYSEVRVEDVEDMLALTEQLWTRLLGDENAEFTLELEDGNALKIPANKVAWFRFVR